MNEAELCGIGNNKRFVLLFSGQLANQPLKYENCKIRMTMQKLKGQVGAKRGPSSCILQPRSSSEASDEGTFSSYSFKFY